MHYKPDSLHKFASAVLEIFGCDDNERAIVADHLLDANLTGHDSHGIGMLPLYAEQVLDGNLVPNQTPDLQPPAGAVSVVDARRALRNSGHVSRVGTYSEYCASKGYVSMHFVNVVGHPPIVAPFGSAESGFSTNPISIAMPVDGMAKPLLDIATSTVAFGKVRVANNNNELMPPGCLLDENGQETLDPAPMAEQRRGSLAAFGEHKGSGLGIFVELLAGALASDHTIASMPDLPSGVINNMLSIIIDPSAFDDVDAIQGRTTELHAHIKACRPATGTEEVLMPGEPEQSNRKRRAVEGIYVDPQTIEQIMQMLIRFPDMQADNCKAIRELLQRS